MAKFFIERPIFAIVIALLIMLAGGLSIARLPIEQVPPIAPPTVQINATYPGASAQTVENTVVQVIEQQMSGIDRLIYLASTSDNTGQATITLTFAPGTNPDIAQVQVQNKLQLAVPLLPAQVQQLGIRVTKSTNSFLMAIGLVSTDGSMSKFDLANYLVSNMQDPISRIDGVGNFNVFGTQYAMRIWLDPTKLTSYALTPLDVTAAVQSQNVQIAGGQLGGTPAPATQQLNASITEATLLRTPEEFGAILLKALPDGSQVRLRDVARVERGAETFAIDNKYNGQPASGMLIQLATGANALATANAVRARVDELSKYFPPGVQAVYPNDTTPFIRISITEVVKTLLEGIALVFLVMFLFLQNWRATIIPTITIPVVLLGTFGVMAALGFTINTLSMFGMVLAIGLLVDDAIVVVENVERVMTEEGLAAPEATRKAMGQITGALIGVAAVLSAVFIPVSFSSGSVGAIYRQFALTIVAAMLLSVFVALTLTPALCALLLKPGSAHGGKNRFARWFNASFDYGRSKYAGGVRGVIARSGRWFVVYAAVIVAVGFLFVRLPSSFVPNEDQGFFFVQVQAPPGATIARTQVVLDDISAYLEGDEAAAVEANFQVNGFNQAGRGQNQGYVFVRLKDWSERTAPELVAQRVVERLNARFASYKDANIVAVNPPPIQGLGIGRGLRFPAEGRRRRRSRGADAGAQPAPRHGEAGSRPRAGPGQRPRRQPHLQDRHRPREGERARRRAVRHRPVVLDPVGLALHQQLPGHRQPHQAGVRPGRRAVSHEPGGHEDHLRAQHAGHPGPLLLAGDGIVAVRLAQARALQRRVLRPDPGRGAAGKERRTGDGGDGAPRASSCPRGSATNGPGSRCSRSRPATRRSTSICCRCWSCSCASRRSTRAGRSRSPSSWGCRSACWARSPRSAPSACRTMCTSRSGCSSPSAWRRRTRS